MEINSNTNLTTSGTTGQTNASWVHCNITPSQTSQSIQRTNAGSSIEGANPLDTRQVTIGQHQTTHALEPLKPEEGYNKFRETLISLVKGSEAKKEFEQLLTVEKAPQVIGGEKCFYTCFEVHYSRKISLTLQKAILEDIIPRFPLELKQLALLLAFSCIHSNDKGLQKLIPKNLTITDIISNEKLSINVSRTFENYNNKLLEDRFSQLAQTTIHLPKDLDIDGKELITVQDLANELREEIMPKSVKAFQTKWNTASLCAENRRNLRDTRGTRLISTKEDAKLLAIYSMMSNEAADLILHLVLNGAGQYSITTQSPLLTPKKLESLENGNWFLFPTRETQKAMTDLFNAIKDPNSSIEDIKQKTASLIATFDYKKGDSTNYLGGFYMTKPKPVAPEETAAAQETTAPSALPASPTATPTAATTVVRPQSDHPTAAPAPAPAASDTASPIPPNTTPSASPASPTSPAATTTDVQPPSDPQTAAPAPAPAASNTASSISPNAAPSASPAATTTVVQPQIDPQTAAPASAPVASDTASSIPASPTSPTSPTATTTDVQPQSDPQTAPSKGWTTAHPTKETKPETFLSH